jgi:hypothetical protein
MGLSAKSTVAVHLVDLPQMLDDALRQALADTVFDIASGPPRRHRSAAATVVVMEAGPVRDCWMDQLERRPDLSILLIDPRACDAELIELRPQHQSLGTVDMATIVAAIRSAAGWEDRPAWIPAPGDR